MDTMQALELAKNLIRLAKDFNSTAPEQSSQVKRAFKAVASKNDLVRTTTYLMEVVGVRDAQYNQLQDENKDLKELLKVNGINLEDEENGTAQETADQQGAAAASTADDGQLSLLGDTQNAEAAGVSVQNSDVATQA